MKSLYSCAGLLHGRFVCHFSNAKVWSFAILWALFTLTLEAQTTVFSDNFSTNTSATYTTSGAMGGSAWSVTRSADDWAARRNVSPEQLELTNDGSANSANATGWVLAFTHIVIHCPQYHADQRYMSGYMDV